MTGDETIIAAGRFGTGRDGYAAMTKYAKQWPNLVLAIEGCQGIGRHIADRVAGRGEQVVDVPPKLSARARVFATGQGRKTDANRRPLRRARRGRICSRQGSRRSLGEARAGDA